MTELANSKKQYQKSVLWLLLLITIGILIIYFQFLFKGTPYLFWTSGSDTRDSYLMKYSGIVNKIVSGDTALWDFHSGMGSNVLMSQSIVFDPYAIILYVGGIIGGIQTIPFLLVIMTVLKIYGAGLTCYLFLTALKIEEAPKIFASIMYAFCGFLTLWGQHYFFGTYFTLMPLLLWALEKSFTERKYLIGVSIFTAISCISAVYFAYMALIVDFIYVLLRFVIRNEKVCWKLFLKQVLPMILAVMIGILISAVILLPVVYGMLTQSTRLGTSESLTDKLTNAEYDYDLKTTILRLFSNNMLGVENDLALPSANYYAMPCLFFSLLFLLVFPQYIAGLLRKKDLLKNKAARIIGVAAIALLVLFPAFSIILNGFAEVSHRVFYCILPFFAVFSAVGLQNILKEKRLNVWLLLGTSVAGIMVFLYTYNRVIVNGPMAEEAWFKKFLAADTVVFIAMAFLLWRLGKKSKGSLKVGPWWKAHGHQLLTACLMILLMGNVIADSYITNNKRDLGTQEALDRLYSEDTEQVIAEIEKNDNSFFRMEKDFMDVSYYKEAEAQQYYGVSSYSSLGSNSSLAFYQNIWPEIAIGEGRVSLYERIAMQNPFRESLAGVKYILSRNDDLENEFYQKAAQAGEVTAYRNILTDGIGAFHSCGTFIRPEDIQSKSLLEQLVLLGAGTVVSDSSLSEEAFLDADQFLEDHVERLPSDEVIAEEGIWTYGDILIEENSFPGMIQAVAQDNDTSIVLEINQDIWEGNPGKNLYCSFSIGSMESNELQVCYTLQNGNKSYETYKTHYFPQYNRDVIIEIPYKTQSVTFTAIQPFGEQGLGRFQLKKFAFAYIEETPTAKGCGEVFFEKPVKDNRVTGSAVVDKAGIVSAAIPCEKGWRVYVDGEEQEIIPVNYGFSGVLIQPGAHEIEFRYETPMLKLGAIVSGIGIGCFVLFYLLYIRKKR